jgi:hypothetical protein
MVAAVSDNRTSSVYVLSSALINICIVLLSDGLAAADCGAHAHGTGCVLEEEEEEKEEAEEEEEEGELLPPKKLLLRYLRSIPILFRSLFRSLFRLSRSVCWSLRSMCLNNVFAAVRGCAGRKAV